ncbi:thermonuclease family protein [Mycoplasmopsis cynos]|uniref:thermonuclease family protein n=1 Tax=Mycoplasmopsis cynos TaxID=171284 RepID=UPI0030D0DB24
MWKSFKTFLNFIYITIFSILATSCHLSNQKTIVVFVKKVIDGDTIQIINENNELEIIRLYGIDTPETLKLRVNEDMIAKYENFYAQLAKKYLKEQIESSKNKIKISRITKDKFHRTVALIFKNNESLNLLMVKKGYARVAFIQAQNPKKPFYTSTNEQYEFYKELINIELKAKEIQKGIWTHKETDVFFKQL